jgi:hypothetical protein
MDHTPYTLYSGFADYAPKEKPGEVFLWRPEFDFFKDADIKTQPSDSEVSATNREGLDQSITKIAAHFKLGRGQQLILEPASEVIKREDKYRSKCRVPTPGKELTTFLYEVPLGLRKRPWEQPVQDCCSTVSILRPITEGPVTYKDLPNRTATLAQSFIKSPSSKWTHEHPPQLRLSVQMSKKILIWARIMLVNKEDREALQKTDIFRGVLASIYHCEVDPSLVAAFLTHWNIDGHTLLTSQGEMGFPLHTISDAMGIPIVGRLYEEFIPLEPAMCGHVESLYAIYSNLCPVDMKPGSGLVTISTWVDHFLDDRANSFKVSPPSGFADPADPLLQKVHFRVEVRDGLPTAVLGKQRLPFAVTYSPVLYRAAFIAAWLCTYCIPVMAGHYIRPEVFNMAVKIAEGIRVAIGVASLAFLYRKLDSVHRSIANDTKIANECPLFIPGHFIMGWFASFLKKAPIFASLSCPAQHPPFIIDWRGVKSYTMAEAHRIFHDFDDSGQGLCFLDFLGRSSLRFPEGDKLYYIQDGRTNYHGRKFMISICAMELLASCSLGGVTHRRGEHFDNQVYCPHRFARMFNCDQLIPDINFQAEDGKTNSLDFQSYSPNSRDESLQILLRRHLSSRWRPDGHTFSAQPLARGTRCSYFYISWCNQAFGFLQNPSLFYDKPHKVPRAICAPASKPGEHLIARGINQKLMLTQIIIYLFFLFFFLFFRGERRRQGFCNHGESSKKPYSQTINKARRGGGGTSSGQ